MELAIELTAKEEDRYLEIRQWLLEQPETVIGDFKRQWLRLVGEAGTRASDDIPKTWLLAHEFDALSKGERDADNLSLVSQISSRYGYSRSWNLINLDRGYWVLDRDLANQVLAAGIKGEGIAFLHYFDIQQVDYKFQELLIGQIVHRW